MLGGLSAATGRLTERRNRAADAAGRASSARPSSPVHPRRDHGRWSPRSPARMLAAMDRRRQPRRRPRATVPRGGAGRLAVHGPPGRDPHIVPIWFWWDGEAVLVFSKPDAQKVRNMRENPAVMLARRRPGRGLRRRHARGSRRAARRPDRRGHAAGPPGEVRRPARAHRPVGRQVCRPRTRRSSGSCPTTTSAGTAGPTPQSARLAGAPTASLGEPPTGRPATPRVARRTPEPRPPRPRVAGSSRSRRRGRRPRSIRGDAGVSR